MKQVFELGESLGCFNLRARKSPLMLEHTSQFKSHDTVSLTFNVGRCRDSNVVSFRGMEVRKSILWPQSKYTLSEGFKYR